MKRLIFDVDNTLIKWEDHYTSALIKTMKKYNIDIDYKIIDKVIEEQDLRHNIFTKEALLKDINDKTKLTLKMNFIEDLLENQKELAVVDENVCETLEYLSKKYELVILTNYFTETQKGRLEKAKIAHYFKEIIGGDQVLIKPNIESFKKAMMSKDDIMIGDSIRCDIEGAINAGIKAIQIDYFNKYEKSNVPLIRNINELKNIL